MMQNLSTEQIDLILSKGKQYTPALLPADIPRGKLHDCFDHCAIAAAKNFRKYKYVEGLARHPLKPEEWILHAWLTDGTHAFDPTWQCFDQDKVEQPVPTIYIGLEIDLLALANFMKVTGYKSIFANAWRNPALAAKAIKK